MLPRKASLQNESRELEGGEMGRRLRVEGGRIESGLSLP